MIYLPQAFLPMVMVGFFCLLWMFLTKSGAQHAKMLSHGQCVHLSISAGLSTPSTCVSPSLKTQSSLCYSSGQYLVSIFARNYRISMQAGVGWLLCEDSERPDIIPSGWAEPQKTPNLLLQSTEYWGHKLRHRASPKMAASAGPRSALCPTFPYFTYKQKETIKILHFSG